MLVLQAWEDTHSKWEHATKLILNHPKTKLEDCQVCLRRQIYKTCVYACTVERTKATTDLLGPAGMDQHDRFPVRTRRCVLAAKEPPGPDHLQPPDGSAEREEVLHGVHGLVRGQPRDTAQ